MNTFRRRFKSLCGRFVSLNDHVHRIFQQMSAYLRFFYIFCNLSRERPYIRYSVKGPLGQNMCLHGDAFVIPFNLICNMTMFRKVEF